MVSSRSALRLHIKRTYGAKQITAISTSSLFAEGLAEPPRQEDIALYGCKVMKLGEVEGWAFTVPFQTDTKRALPSTYANALSRLLQLHIPVLSTNIYDALKPTVQWREAEEYHFPSSFDLVGRYKAIEVDRTALETSAVGLQKSLYVKLADRYILLYYAGYAASYKTTAATMRIQHRLAKLFGTLYFAVDKFMQAGDLEQLKGEWEMVKEMEMMGSVDWKSYFYLAEPEGEGEEDGRV